MAADEEWTIYESPFFCDEVSKYLTDFELNALRHQLVRDPFAGANVSGLDPLMRIDFAGAAVVYMVHPQSRVIALVQIGRSGRPVEIEEADKSRVKEALGLLRKGGYIAAGKELAQWIIQIVKDWLPGS